MKPPSYDLRPCGLPVVVALCEAHHGYGGAGNAATYCFAVYEDGKPVAAFAWNPPPPGAAHAVCPEQPAAVLALSRMVAIEREDRRLRHISKPLRQQMRKLIDRHRWPVLVTYHDEGQGHNGHVYKCSGWRRVQERRTPVFEDAEGVRRSRYSNGKTCTTRYTRCGSTVIVRWEHWACERGSVSAYMQSGGWVRRLLVGKRWKSGNPAYTWVRTSQTSTRTKP